MNILAIIPARGGSKGVPRKNIRLLAGKPMIAWTIEAARSSKYINKVIVSTEDEEIKNIALNCGAKVPFLRPRELAEDDTPGIDPVLFTLEKLKRDYQYSPDIVILLQPTSPLRKTIHIEKALNMFIEKMEEFDSLISVTELEHPVTWNRVLGQNNQLKDFIHYDKSSNYRRQDAEKVYRLNGAIYITKREVLIKDKTFETDKTIAYVMDRKASVDIDRVEDLELAEYYLNLQRKL